MKPVEIKIDANVRNYLQNYMPADVFEENIILIVDCIAFVLREDSSGTE